MQPVRRPPDVIHEVRQALAPVGAVVLEQSEAGQGLQVELAAVEHHEAPEGQRVESQIGLGLGQLSTKRTCF